MKNDEVAWGTGGFVTGALVGGLFGYFKFRADSEEDDRPPIIVKGGSLRFISGDKDSSDPDEKNGRPWIDAGDLGWQPIHRKGKKVKWLIVELNPSNGTCPAVSMTKMVTITYDSKEFVLRIGPRVGGGGDAPMLVTRTTLKHGGTTQNPEVFFEGGSGEVTKVEFTTKSGKNIVCVSPDQVTVWQM